jgi:hypothetical protein
MYFSAYSPVVSETRNTLLCNTITDSFFYTLDALKPTKVFNGQLRCKKIIFIDSDMVWSEEDLKTLLESNYEVVSGVYPLSDNIHSSVKDLKTDKFVTIDEVKLLTTPFPIAFGGLGFTACSFEVIDSLSYPWFSVKEETQVIDGVEYQKFTGEDTYFFNKIRETGIVPMANPNIKVGHQKLLNLVI